MPRSDSIASVDSALGWARYCAPESQVGRRSRAELVQSGLTTCHPKACIRAGLRLGRVGLGGRPGVALSRGTRRCRRAPRFHAMPCPQLLQPPPLARCRRPWSAGPAGMRRWRRASRRRRPCSGTRRRACCRLFTRLHPAGRMAGRRRGGCSARGPWPTEAAELAAPLQRGRPCARPCCCPEPNDSHSSNLSARLKSCLVALPSAYPQRICQ